MPHDLETLAVMDPDGGRVYLGTLWTERTAVLVFVRHFGCVFCQQQVAQIRPLVADIHHAGAELYVVGHGSVAEARAFRERQDLAVPVLTDPERQAYCALGLRRGPHTVFRPSVAFRGIAAYKAGYRQARLAGDPFQQGGVVVIGPGGVERYRHVSRFAGDHPDPTEVLRFCRTHDNEDAAAAIRTRAT